MTLEEAMIDTDVAERIGARLASTLRLEEWNDRARYMTTDGIKSNVGLARLIVNILDEETAK